MTAIHDAQGNYLHEAEPIPPELIVLTTDEKLVTARSALDAVVDNPKATMADVVNALAALRAALG